MRDNDDDLPFMYSVLPICLSLEERYLPVHPDSQRQAFFDVTGQIIEALSVALKKTKEDPWAAVRVIVKGERIVAEYVDEGFDLLEPFQRDLQDTLHTAWRMARRQFIRRALRCQPYETETFIRHFRELGSSGAEAMEDFRAVESALMRGVSIFEDLRRRHRSRVVGRDYASGSA
jgi:hypothetical protein